jgi:hypothetical protein
MMSLRALVLGLISLFSVVAPAAATSIRCDTCSPSAKRQVAIAAGEGMHLVYDLVNSQAVGFVVEPDDQYPGALTAALVDVEPWVKDQVAAFSLLFAATGGSMIISASIDSEDINVEGIAGKTAFDVLEDMSLRTRISDSLWLSPPSRGVDSALLAVMESIKAIGLTLRGFPTSAVFVVTFPDGSSASFKTDLEGQRVSYVRGSGRTSNGQPIPETNDPFEVTGTYDLPPGDSPTQADRFILHLTSLGVPVGNASSVGPGGGARVVCTFDGKTLHCTVYPK